MSNFHDLLTTSRFGRTPDEPDEPNRGSIARKSLQDIPRMASLNIPPVAVDSSDGQSEEPLSAGQADDRSIVVSLSDAAGVSLKEPLSDHDTVASEDATLENTTNDETNSGWKTPQFRIQITKPAARSSPYATPKFNLDAKQ